MTLRNTLKSHIYTLITLIWIGIIFAFSLQGGEDSTNQSGFIVGLVISLFKLLSLPTEGYNLVFYVRKLAHFTEYFILGIFFALAQKEMPKMHPLTLVLIPVIDESIQYFTPGRVMSPFDMMIDALGYACGYTLTSLGLKVFRNTK